MRILTDLEFFRPNPDLPLILALGNFDGMHLGHQALLTRVIDKARKRKGISAVFTFLEHPQRILHPESRPSLLSSPVHKLFLLDQLGVALCFLVPFTREFSRMAPSIFVEEILVKRLGVSQVCLGYNARFGHERKGDAVLMQALASKHGFLFEEMPPVRAARDFVSSSRIRKLIEGGNLEEAGEALGRPFSIFATVVKGAGRGTGLGTPTANLEPESEILPPEGVYPVTLRMIHCEPIAEVSQGDKEFKMNPPGPWLEGVLNYGRRPTFEKEKARPVPEVFIFDFRGELYGKTLEIVFHPPLRREIAFSSSQALQAQIAQDIQTARAYFASRAKKTFTRTSD